MSDVLAAKREVLHEARAVISQYLVTAERWRYDRVMWAFAVMLGEVPEDTPEPVMLADPIASQPSRAESIPAPDESEPV